MRWYKRDPDAALNGMAVLSLAERGAYNSLLDLLYCRDGNVPDDDLLVARMMRCHWREWRKIKAVLISHGKVWSEGGKLKAKRVADTLKEAADFAQEQRKKAARSSQDCENIKENNTSREPSTTTTTTTTTKEEKEEEKRESQVARKRALPLKAPLPENWFPPSEAFSPTDSPELEKMRDWARSNAILKADWLATWRNWKRRAPQFNGRNDSGRERSVLEAGKRIDSQLKAMGATDNYVPGSSGPRPLELDKPMRANGPKLISSR